jgi:hypothetical protein
MTFFSNTQHSWPVGRMDGALTVWNTAGCSCWRGGARPATRGEGAAASRLGAVGAPKLEEVFLLLGVLLEVAQDPQKSFLHCEL